MNMKRIWAAVVGIVLFSVGVTTVVAADEAPQNQPQITSEEANCNGVWRAMGRSGILRFDLKQDGERVWGTYDSPDGVPPLFNEQVVFNEQVEGTLKNAALHLKIVYSEYGYFSFTETDLKKFSGDGLEKFGFRFTAEISCIPVPQKAKKK